MKNAVTFAIGIIFALSLWVRAEVKEHTFPIKLMTNFDFTNYP